MGNELSVKIPTMIQSAEAYVADLADYDFVCSLASTRFMKVAKVQNSEGLCVVKMFVHQDSSIPIDWYRLRVESINKSLTQSALNCSAFSRVLITQRCSMLVRQYQKYTLYDRLSTRPYLQAIEKKWIAFQLLQALAQTETAKVCHGDIKAQNVLLSSHNWVVLTDFASFKPVILPYDNPSDYSYFFDTSRKRSCYIAPERFDSSANIEEQSKMGVSNQPLTNSMDIFSLGCVLFELFTDGQMAYSFGQMLSFVQRQERGCDLRVLECLTEHEHNKHLLHLVVPMMDRLPQFRPTAKQVLEEHKGTIFPNVFYDLCYPYLSGLVMTPLKTCDETIERIYQDRASIMDSLQTPTATNTNTECYVLFLSVVTAQIRALKHLPARVQAIQLLHEFAKIAENKVILDRILPYMLYMLFDTQERVRARALQTVIKVLHLVTDIQREDARILHDYVLPRISSLLKDDSSLVRTTVAANMSELADIALKFSDLAAVHYSEVDPQVQAPQPTPVNLNVRRDKTELQDVLQEMVVTILCDSDNVIKRTLVQHKLHNLCMFFGPNRASDAILSHMITFLNDKHDHQLRASFFGHAPDAALSIGAHSCLILKPLLQQGLCDWEESVVEQCLLCIWRLCDQGLMQKPAVYDLFNDAVPFLVHPNRQLRLAAVQLVCGLQKVLNVADLYCKVTPKLNTYLLQPNNMHLHQQLLYRNLRSCIPRRVWTLAVRYAQIGELMEFLREKRLLNRLSPIGTLHDKTATGGNVVSSQSLADNSNKALSALYQKMCLQGLNEQNEYLLLQFKLVLGKMRKLEASSSMDFSPSSPDRPGSVAIEHLLSVARKHADLSIHRQHQKRMRTSRLQKEIETAMVRHFWAIDNFLGNDEWSAMFGGGKLAPSTAGGDNIENRSTQKTNTNTGNTQHASTSDLLISDQSQSNTVDNQSIEGTDQTVSIEGTVGAGLALATTSSSILSSTSTVTTDSATLMSSSAEPVLSDDSLVYPASTIVDTTSAMDTQGVVSACRERVSNLIEHKRQQWHKMSGAGTNHSHELNGTANTQTWTPRALHIAHLHEHTAAVRRLAAHPQGRHFVSGSVDGSVRLWDLQAIEGTAVINRSVNRFCCPESDRVRCVRFLANGCHMACSGDKGHIYLYDIMAQSNKNTFTTLNTLMNTHGSLVEFDTWSDGWSDILFGVSHHGYVLSWDVRAGAQPVSAYQLPDECELVASCCVDRAHEYWACMGTTNGTLLLWDIRFSLPVNKIRHSKHRCVGRVWSAADSAVWATFTGNGETSKWSLETGECTNVLWPGGSSAMNYTTTSTLCTTALATVNGTNQVLTGDTNGTLRLWHQDQPKHSRLISGASDLECSYEQRMIDGVQVVVERYSATQEHSFNTTHNNQLHTGNARHLDAISDLCVLNSGQQNTLVSAAYDGVIKIWL